MTTDDETPFWQRKKLSEMTDTEWESLCDGCAKCCLHKLQYDDTGEIDYTNVACRLLDTSACRCRKYAIRSTLVPDCVRLTAEVVPQLNWLPSTCAYRLIDEGRDLPYWHPLKTGDAESVHKAGMSVRGRAVREQDAGPLEHHIVHWDDC
ncbi:MAG: YcgN family cysteine cluster protein [Rhodospirillales bacterium]